MIQMVYERCRQSEELGRVIVATDDERIKKHVEAFGGECALTSPDCPTGTDRIYEVVREVDCEIVVNIQGDEPLIDPGVIDTCVRSLRSAPDAVCATPVTRTRDPEKINSTNTAKVALNTKGEALYFSRSPIPFNRSAGESLEYFKHVGMYAYRKEFLGAYVGLEQTPNELAESLEQLRMLENGYIVQTCEVEYEAIGVDTPEDLEVIKGLVGV